jgi:urease accessory protein
MNSLLRATDLATSNEGWQASLRLGFAPRAGKTAMVERRQRGPLAVQRPFYPEGDVCHLYLLHPPGGVVGGDGLQIEVDVQSGARSLLTTPGATKFYRSTGALATQRQQLQVADGAALEWLPQENIFFPGAVARFDSRISLTGSARFIGWECHCLGRPVIDERFDSGSADFNLLIERDSQPLLRERFRATPERLGGAASLRGQPVLATLLATPAGEAELAAAREQIAEHKQAAATLLDDLLLVRYLGDSTEQCRRLFTAIWSAIREPVIGRAPCPPRIWAT